MEGIENMKINTNYSSLVVARCEGCLSSAGKRCKAFVDPDHQWKAGECWGRVTDMDEVEQREKEILEYAGKAV